ncbi:hypothetical protein HHK36_028483 [Tetracentron sinense]|uniref:t-SNARE coiled-coil homology domain-containing protein n=1 Tax=Tetracentron sinense TaxID=13715 RepID=A0A834YBF8_TETSI|nr:hypothetical protein HHK36_028483 [Tetracentron sinense]
MSEIRNYSKHSFAFQATSKLAKPTTKLSRLEIQESSNSLCSLNSSFVLKKLTDQRIEVYAGVTTRIWSRYDGCLKGLIWNQCRRREQRELNKESCAGQYSYLTDLYLVGQIVKLQSTFHQWEHIPSNTGERVHFTKELLAGCESIEWQVDELDKAIAVAARDPSWYGIDEMELEQRRRWTSTARTQVGTVRKAVEAGKEQNSIVTATSLNGMRQELMRLPNDRPYQTGRSNQYAAQDNDDFISSESDRQLLLIKQQDEELDELSASVERIGGVGLTIHEELREQEKIMDELSLEMESTSSRLDFVQKKVGLVMKKAGAKGQFMMIAFLVILFIVLFVLVFFT